jgi:hypothetical protein
MTGKSEKSIEKNTEKNAINAITDQKNIIDQKNIPPSAEASWIPRLKDASIFMGWIGGLLLIGGLCWFLSTPLRSRLLMKAVNRVLVRTGDSRRLDAPIPLSELGPKALRMGTWYGIAFSREGSRAVVFTFIAEGRFFPCVAEVNREGSVKEIVPLSRHGEAIFKGLSPGSLQIYIRRIEGIRGGTP